MNIIYFFSVIYLLILFLLYKKKDDKMCFLSSLVYSIGILFCYNTFVVFLLYLLKINCSMFIYSLINYIIGSIFLFLCLNKKNIQKYYLDKKKLFVMLGLIFIIYFICYIRYDGYEVIQYESGDSAVHYRHALEFSEELSILDENNSQDEVFNYFKRVMPISYVNCGFLFNMFSMVKTYMMFLYYNVFLLMMSAILFFITVNNIIKSKNNEYIFSTILTLFYIFAFPFNNFMMGFCYLNLSIIVINLLFLVIFDIKNNYNEGIIFKIINIFLLTFSVFYSYYLFIPAIYLCLGIYYIWLWKKKIIDFKKLILYGSVTLIIPFIMGFCYFLITLFIDEGVGSIVKLINLWGYSYNNITPMFLLVFVFGYIIFKFKGKKKFNYLEMNLCIMTLYVGLFFILYVIKLSDLYYFYKLFAVYWLIVILFFIPKFIQFKKVLYVLMIIICISSVFVSRYHNTDVAEFIGRTNIYSWNAAVFNRDDLTFDKDELDILEKSTEYEDVCLFNNRFLLLGDIYKNIWYYSITDNIPIYFPVNGNSQELYKKENAVPSMYSWENALKDYPCLIYYYEGKEVSLDKNKYNILYENSKGAIIKRLK